MGMRGEVGRVIIPLLIKSEQIYFLIFFHIACPCSTAFQEKVCFFFKSLQITHVNENVLQTVRYHANTDADFSTIYTRE